MTTPLHSLSPQELAHHGIPVEVALRARIEECDSVRDSVRSPEMASLLGAKARGLRDALAIIEAKGTPDHKSHRPERSTT